MFRKFRQDSVGRLDRAAQVPPGMKLDMNSIRRLVVLLFALALAFGAALAQRSAREMDERQGGSAPSWKVDPPFKKDVFTFVRIKYSVDGKHGFGRGTDPENRWAIDMPDSDLNFSFRVQQLTSLKVNPDGKVLEITDKELFDYPFIYIVEPGRLTFTDKEVPILRRYLLNGGFLMCDDFWGDRDWVQSLPSRWSRLARRPLACLRPACRSARSRGGPPRRGHHRQAHGVAA